MSANLLTNAQNDHSKSPLPPFKKGGKIPAFTLAEVLVTLGLIGVVAAMTLPMLAKNYQFYVRQQQFKKAYAGLEIAIQKTQIDLGEGVKCFYVGYTGNANRKISECKYFFSQLANNFQQFKYCENNGLSQKCLPNDFRGGEVVYAEVQGGTDKEAAKTQFNSGCSGFSTTNLTKRSPVYVMNNGVYLVPYFDGVNYYPFFIIDINGHIAPNKYGHDIFVFDFLKKSQYDSVFKLNPSNQCHPLDIGGYYTKHFVEYLYGRNAEL